MDEETLAFEELSKLNVNGDSSSVESSLKKENFNVVFVGHVGKRKKVWNHFAITNLDAGKSTIGGHIL